MIECHVHIKPSVRRLYYYISESDDCHQIQQQDVGIHLVRGRVCEWQMSRSVVSRGVFVVGRC